MAGDVLFGMVYDLAAPSEPLGVKCLLHLCDLCLRYGIARADSTCKDQATDYSLPFLTGETPYFRVDGDSCVLCDCTTDFSFSIAS